MTRVTPLFDEHVSLGAQMINFGDWQMPVRYKGDKIEHMAVRKNAGIFDVSHMGEIFLEGKDALQTADRLCSNNISGAKDGQALYSGLLSEKGTFIDDVMVYRFSRHKILICTNASNDEKDFKWVSHVLDREFSKLDVNARWASDELAQIAIQGPNATKIVESACGKEVTKIPPYHFCEHKVSFGKSSGFVILARTGYTGEDGFEVFLPKQRAKDFWRTLLDHGAPHKLMPCGLASRDTLRLEAGMCLYGNEIDETTTPYEARLSWIVKTKKPILAIGAEALARQKEKGITRKLCGIELLHKGIARKGYDICDNKGAPIGQVTSGTMSSFLQKSIAMGYVKMSYATIGSQIKIAIRGKLVDAMIVKLPFYKRRSCQ